jgi:hypothetical protein
MRSLISPSKRLYKQENLKPTAKPSANNTKEWPNWVIFDRTKHGYGLDLLLKARLYFDDIADGNGYFDVEEGELFYDIE